MSQELELDRPRSKERDLTSGSLHRSIWALAVPMMLEMGIINVAFVLDTYWVGQLGSAALAAVTISVTIRWVINSLSNGLGVGGMAVVARRIGEGDRAAAERAAWQTILLCLILSFSLSILGLLTARPLLEILGADAQVLPLGVSYLRVTFGGMFTFILVFAINALLRGAGEARLAMMVQFLATAVTVILEPILILGLGPLPGLGITGSAWAFILGFGAGLVLQAIVLLRGRAKISINVHDLRPDLPLILHIIRIALPSTIQMTVRSSARLITVGLIGAYGTFATAGYGIANRMQIIALIPVFGLGNAAGTLVGQNLGAGKPRRAAQSAWWVGVYAMSYIAIAAILLFVFAHPLISLFDPTPQVVKLGEECSRIVAPSLIVNAIGIVLSSAFGGAGDTTPPMVINLLSLWAAEIPLAYSLSRLLGLGSTGLWWGRAISNATSGLLSILWFHRGKWKKRKV